MKGGKNRLYACFSHKTWQLATSREGCTRKKHSLILKQSFKFLQSTSLKRSCLRRWKCQKMKANLNYYKRPLVYAG